MTAERFVFDRFNGASVDGFRLSAGTITATVVAHGARLQALTLPDRDGRQADVVLGPADIAGHAASKGYFGATCGRYGNRIGHARFTLDGDAHAVSANQAGAHHLHGGFAGFDSRIWSAEPGDDGRSVSFSLVSEDGEEGYPGRLTATTSYRLDEEGLHITMQAETDRPTVVNLVNHTYWNLAGEGERTVRDHVLELSGGFYTPTDDQGIPTGEIRSVEGTPFDFRAPKPVGRDLDRVPPSSHGKAGYDNNVLISGREGTMRRFARLSDPGSGRGVELFSDAPGMQLYTGGHLHAGITGKAGRPYEQFGGLALESQSVPDAPNVGHFPSARLDPGAVFERRMRFRFFTE